MGRGRHSYTVRGSPTKNWSKLLTHRSFSGAILCDTGSFEQNHVQQWLGTSRRPLKPPLQSMKPISKICS